MADERIVISTRFERVLLGVERELSIALERARAEADHAGIKGDKVEIATRKVLRDRMPPNLSVGEGIVYDSFGDETGQTDVILANGEQPFTFPWGESGEYLIEGVSAVGEVKSKLTPGELKDCIKKGTTYKRLRQIVGPSDAILNSSPYMTETSALPPFFVIAHEPGMTIPTLLRKLHDAPPVAVPDGKDFPNDSPQPPLDAVCILGQGVAVNQRSGRGAAFQFSVDGKPFPGWIFMGNDAPLAILLGWLHMAMPRILRAHSVVGQYNVAPPPQALYMVNKVRSAQGLEPFTGDMQPMQFSMTAVRPKAEKGTGKKSR
jgi:hypothetical protein